MLMLVCAELCTALSNGNADACNVDSAGDICEVCGVDADVMS